MGSAEEEIAASFEVLIKDLQQPKMGNRLF
jgi:hypothetical protein